jgi:hypothetical protein
MSETFIPPEYFLNYLPKTPTKVVFLDMLLDEDWVTVMVDLSVHPDPWKVINEKNFVNLLIEETFLHEDKTCFHYYELKNRNDAHIAICDAVNINTNRIAQVSDLLGKHPLFGKDPYDVFTFSPYDYKNIKAEYEHSRS